VGTGGRHAAATDPTRVVAVGAGGSNSETSVAAWPACVSGGREHGRVKRDRWASRQVSRDYGDYTGALFSVLWLLCIILCVDFNG